MAVIRTEQQLQRIADEFEQPFVSAVANLSHDA